MATQVYQDLMMESTFENTSCSSPFHHQGVSSFYGYGGGHLLHSQDSDTVGVILGLGGLSRLGKSWNP